MHYNFVDYPHKRMESETHIDTVFAVTKRYGSFQESHKNGDDGDVSQDYRFTIISFIELNTKRV